jgi:hypothetical protein
MPKISMEVEVLLPTRVTKEIELPLFLYCKGTNSYHHVITCESGYTWSAVKETEVKFYADGSIRIYKHSLSESQFSKMVAMIEDEYEVITSHEFLEAYKLFLNQEIEWMNELISKD